MSIEGPIQDVQTLHKVVTNGDSHGHAIVRVATNDFIGKSDPLIVREYVFDAANQAINNGDGSAAWMLKGVINGPNSWGHYLKNATSQLLSNNPRLIQYFGPDFTKGLLDRLSTNGHSTNGHV